MMDDTWSLSSRSHTPEMSDGQLLTASMSIGRSNVDRVWTVSS